MNRAPVANMVVPIVMPATLVLTESAINSDVRQIFYAVLYGAPWHARELLQAGQVVLFLADLVTQVQFAKEGSLLLGYGVCTHPGTPEYGVIELGNSGPVPGPESACCVVIAQLQPIVEALTQSPGRGLHCELEVTVVCGPVIYRADAYNRVIDTDV